jgi:sugar-specific transcriptional regulator TrmB/DNA-binding CsgD family transcriptional regulator
MLRELGLSAVCERVYQALLEEPALVGDEVAERLGLTHGEVSDALDELADLALLRMSRTEPTRPRAVSLDRGVALLIARQEAELVARQQALAVRRAAADAAAEAAARSRTEAGVELLTDLDEVQARMESLVQAARNSCQSIVPTVMSPGALRAARQLDLDLLARGVGVRNLCHEGVRTNPAALAFARQMAEAGARIRTAPALPMRLLVIDGTTAVVPIDPDGSGRGAALITTPGVLRAFADLFERLWHDGTPLEDTRIDQATGLTTSETELLRLLADGLTDEAAAKRLNVSVRTVKRRMEDLTRRLDAGSRFQAGLRAGQRGWL